MVKATREVVWAWSFSASDLEGNNFNLCGRKRVVEPGQMGGREMVFELGPTLPVVHDKIRLRVRENVLEVACKNPIDYVRIVYPRSLGVVDPFNACALRTDTACPMEKCGVFIPKS